MGAVPSRLWPNGRQSDPEMTCDYNGWNDAPEEEREWFDQHPEIWSGMSPERDSRTLKSTPTAKPWPRR
jgi:hypothetical protein